MFQNLSVYLAPVTANSNILSNIQPTLINPNQTLLHKTKLYGQKIITSQLLITWQYHQTALGLRHARNKLSRVISNRVSRWNGTVRNLGALEATALTFSFCNKSNWVQYSVSRYGFSNCFACSVGRGEVNCVSVTMM